MPYSLFSNVESAPPDPILGLTENFRKDANPKKINLTTGVYQDETGVNPVLKSIKQAERIWLETETTKEYLGIGGEASYALTVQKFVFGADHPVVSEGRAVTAHTPGGTGPLRVAGDFLHDQFPGAAIWVSDPTWPNHHGVFKSAGLKVNTYPYYDPETRGLRFEELMATLEAVPENDVVLLHGCCHNPSGVDPTPEQWDRIIQVFQQRPILPLLDFAYQGFGKGLEADSYAVRAFASAGLEMIVSSSFSKNFGMYRERVGALTVVTGNPTAATAVMTRLKQAIRVNYSSPPSHGGNVVEMVIGNQDLHALWEQELDEMRERIQAMRRLFVETLKKFGVRRDFEFLLRQNGMFSFSGITKTEVIELREKYAIYLVENGRINVAGMTKANMDYLCQSIAAVLTD